jgi:uncharacterized membrane protein YuzA (DUF378 family)
MNGEQYRFLQVLSYTFIIIGALNWGLIGFFGFDLVAALFGEMSFLTRTVYSLVGLSAIISLIIEFTVCKSLTRCYTS